VLALLAAAALLGSGPEIPQLPPIRRDPQITYLDRSGAVIGVRGGRFAPPVDIDRLPPYVPAAFIAIEDRRF
jgi:penicillin-binding protein 1A